MLIVPTELVALGLAVVWFLALAFLVLAIRQWDVAAVLRARQRLFAARSRIFLLFACSEAGVAHPAHRLIRRDLNDMIRFAHRLTWVQLVAGRAVARTAWADKRNADPLRMLAASQPELAEQVRPHVTEAYVAVWELIISRSPLPLALKIAWRLLRPVRRLIGRPAPPATASMVHHAIEIAGQEELLRAA